MQGKVKWFSETRGYGFITADDGREIFCHYREIQKTPTEDKVNLFEGQTVEFDIRDTPRGTAAVNIIRL